MDRERLLVSSSVATMAASALLVVAAVLFDAGARPALFVVPGLAGFGLASAGLLSASAWVLLTLHALITQRPRFN